MKHIRLPRQKLFLLLLACALPSLWLQAQNPEPEKRSEDSTVPFQIKKKKNGRKHVHQNDGKQDVDEPTYRADELTPPGGSFWFSDSLGKGFGTDQDLGTLRQQFEKFLRDATGDSLKNGNRFFPFNPTDLQNLLENQDGMKKFRFYLDTADASSQFRLDTLDGNLPSELFQPSESKTDPFGKFPFGADRVELDYKDYEVRELKTDQGKKYIITRRKRPK